MTGEKVQIRVRKTETQNDRWAKPDGLAYCLDCWKAWMSGDADRDLGVKTTPGLAGAGQRPDLYEAQQASDARVAAATDAMIDSLAQVQRWAIYASCSIGTPWRFPNADLVHAAADARAALTAKLKRNICTAALF